MRLVKSITKNKLAFFLLLALFLFTSLAYSAEPKEGYKYVGSVNSNKYHYFSCKWAEKIYQSNAIYFKSAKEAQQSGYIPCKVCKPPVED